MASEMTRLRWRLQNKISSHKQDIYLVSCFLAILFVILYCVLLRFDAPSMTDSRYDHYADHQLVKELVDEMNQNPKHRILVPNLVNPEREKKIFERVQEKIKDGKKPIKKPNRPFDVTRKPEKNNEEKLEEAQEKNIKKDKEYWMKKYAHVFNGGKYNDSDIRIQADSKLKGGKAQCIVYNHMAHINETYDCVQLKIQTKPQICLYPTEEDIHLSQHIKQEGEWEPHIVKLFMDYLATDPDIGFIDVGANIGVYTLTAASLGHPVVAIEPYDKNLRHLSRGIQLSRVEDKVTVLQNAISDKRLNYLDLRLDPTNQGGIHVDESNHNYKCYEEDCPPQVKAIYMDDVLEVVNFKSAIIKIDIEGHEHRAFRESSELFDRLYIPCIIMEWIKLREYFGTELTESRDKDMVYDLVEMLLDRGYKAFSMVTGQKLAPSYWYSWPDDIIWKHELVGLV